MPPPIRKRTGPSLSSKAKKLKKFGKKASVVSSPQHSQKEEIKPQEDMSSQITKETKPNRESISQDSMAEGSRESATISEMVAEKEEAILR